MNKLFAIIKAEPVRLVAAVQATLAAAVMFGVDITADQLSGIAVAIAAWLAFVTRSAVTPK